MHTYTSAQQEAISTIEQNLQIIACAGSGKTQVISQRIVEILKKGAHPSKSLHLLIQKKRQANYKQEY